MAKSKNESSRRPRSRASIRGSSDLTVTLLLTAAGAAMVGLTVPTMMKSSDTASRTFDRQVKILERGAGGSTSQTGASDVGTSTTPGFEVGGGTKTLGTTPGATPAIAPTTNGTPLTKSSER